MCLELRTRHRVEEDEVLECGTALVIEQRLAANQAAPLGK
jgi:hypothetical protein